MLRVENMDDERLLYNIITPEIPKHIKDKLLEAIEEFEEQRSI
ncbi:MAG: hypothetical protein ACFFAE_21605 [Candidatus Hodarchaeota archaeon]